MNWGGLKDAVSLGGGECTCRNESGWRCSEQDARKLSKLFRNLR